jgi:hypothetical protein
MVTLCVARATNGGIAKCAPAPPGASAWDRKAEMAARNEGHRQVEQVTLFYEFSLPTDHLLRSMTRFVKLGELRRELP